MGSGTKNRKKSVAQYVPTDKQRDAMVWAIDRYIKIWPSPTTKGPNPTEWYINIQIGKGPIKKAPDTYDVLCTLWETIYSYYEYYYDKRND